MHTEQYYADMAGAFSPSQSEKCMAYFLMLLLHMPLDYHFFIELTLILICRHSNAAGRKMASADIFALGLLLAVIIYLYAPPTERAHYFDVIIEQNHLYRRFIKWHAKMIRIPNDAANFTCIKFYALLF